MRKETKNDYVRFLLNEYDLMVTGRPQALAFNQNRKALNLRLVDFRPLYLGVNIFADMYGDSTFLAQAIPVETHIPEDTDEIPVNSLGIHDLIRKLRSHINTNYPDFANLPICVYLSHRDFLRHNPRYAIAPYRRLRKTA
ncbi:MAG: hypothetical protein Q7S45_00745 [Candidatus Curtissbacteria bacterium]|nr:hypothetical protein [Candidatus Curtissbacteria bacterium]